MHIVYSALLIVRHFLFGMANELGSPGYQCKDFIVPQPKSCSNHLQITQNM